MIDPLVLALVSFGAGGVAAYFFFGSTKQREDIAAERRASAEAALLNEKNRKAARVERGVRDRAERKAKQHRIDNMRAEKARRETAKKRELQERQQELAEKQELRATRVPLLEKEAKEKSEASLEAVTKEAHRLARITKLDIRTLTNNTPGRHVCVDWEGNADCMVSVFKAIGGTVTSDIERIKKRKGDDLITNLSKNPVESFDINEVTGVQVVYYAWLSYEVTYSKYSVDEDALELVSHSKKAMVDWGLELEKLFLPAPKDSPKPSVTPPEEQGHKPPAPPRTIPKIDELTAEVLVAVVPIVEAKRRKEKLEGIVKKFVEEHGLEDDAGDVAQAAYDALDAFNQKANKKG